MRGPYGLNIVDDCRACPIRARHLFCDLPAPSVERLNQITSPAIYPPDALLFIEGQQSRGIFVLCSGRAKLFIRREGKTLITRIAGPGDLLGLASMLLQRPYAVTAQMMDPGQANFVCRDHFLEFMRTDKEVALRAANEVSRDYYAMFECIRNLGLGGSPAEKFARLLLYWSDATAQIDRSLPCTLSLTQGEIAELIGTTRETVSRLFTRFKEQQLVALHGANLVLKDRATLERFVQY